MKAKIELIISKIVKEMGIDIISAVEAPKNISNGDYTTNIALVLSKILKKAPVDIASDLVKRLKKENIKEVSEIEATGNGFINFWLSEDYLLKRLSKKEAGKKSSGQKIMVEFTDPNPFKLFHIGHLYSNIVGESIARFLESAGNNVKRANYQGDVGLHVAKSVWGIQREIKNAEDLKKWETKSLDARIQLLGRCYSLGSKAYEEEESAKKEIIEINKKIYGKDKSTREIYQKGKDWSLEYFEKIYKRLGTKFAFYYFESQSGEVGLNLVKEYEKKGIFEKSDGAVIFPGEKYGLHNRVFINSQGFPTYEAKELGLAPTKYKDFPYERSIIITGNEINEYFKVVLAALSKINPTLASKTVHISHGMVRLSSSKISSRLGNIISGETLLDDVKSKIKKNFKEMDDKTAEIVTIGSVKFALLKTRLGKDIEFNIDQSISIEGDSGPYIQYAYVRTQSVLAKAPTNLLSSKRGELLTEEDILVLRTLSRFQDVIEEVVSSLTPNLLCTYLFDLCQRFNFLYQKHQILNNSVRLSITEATGRTIKNGLDLLGIEAPVRM